MDFRTITATGNVVLENGEKGHASTIVLQALDTGWSGTVIVKAAISGTTNFVPIPYKRRSLVAAASDDTLVSATITDTAFLIEINSTGLDIQLVTTTSAGTLTLNWITVRA